MSKPPYRVPLMSEIADLPWNGYRVASTFSGCGGSSLGYKMAGFKVVWASEFIPAAQEVYRLNHPDTILDTRDIRNVRAEEILAATGLGVGELDIFDGSPPCASFSTAGKLSRDWGKVKNYSETKQRTDDLFFEYSRLVKELQPKVFVAENVSGLVKGVAKGYFLNILKTLKECGYCVEARLLDAQWLGVPQMRQRIIFIGVRNDLKMTPAFPKPLPCRYSIKEALEWDERKSIVQGNRNGHSGQRGEPVLASNPAPTAITVGASGQFVIQEYVEGRLIEKGAEIDQFAIGDEWDKLSAGDHSARFYNLIKPRADMPSSTITARGGEPSAASVTHPTEKRKFSIAELKRICAFPDDFVLTGSYAQQWERLGRAVPPIMMMHIASAIRDNILNG